MAAKPMRFARSVPTYVSALAALVAAIDEILARLRDGVHVLIPEPFGFSVSTLASLSSQSPDRLTA